MGKAIAAYTSSWASVLVAFGKGCPSIHLQRLDLPQGSNSCACGAFLNNDRPNTPKEEVKQLNRFMFEVARSPERLNL